MIRVFILGSHEVVRRGLIDVTRSGGMHVVGEAATVAEALRRIPAARPHIVVVELGPADGDSVAGCAQIRTASPATRCMVIGWDDDQLSIRGAAAAGATGYLPMRSRGSQILQVMHQVAAGLNVIELNGQGTRSPVAPSRAPARRSQPEPLAGSGETRATALDPASATLSTRQREILQRLAVGMTNREIAQDLSLAEKTVANNISGLMAKLGVRTRTQAAVLAANLRSMGTGG